VPKVIRQFFRLTLAVLALVSVSFAAEAEEAITNFTSAIVLATDGSVDVTETITVNAESIHIRRGIFRDVFTELRNDDGSRLRSSLKVVSVTRDGRPEPYDTEGISKGTRIRIGDADVFLSRGTHTYIIRYTMTRMARRFADHDELYWNVTGNFWDFPINRASAAVTLPDGAIISGVTGYTGVLGSKAQDLTSTRTSDTTASFAARNRLDPGEGLTIAVAFNKGVLAEPQGGQGLIYWLSDHRDVILPSIAVLIVLLYNFLAWHSVGRDPKKGTIIPLFHAPKGMSPALVHYVREYGWKGSGWNAFTASIFNLGVKGLVEIDNQGKTLTVTATNASAPADLGPGEKLLHAYFTREGSVTVNKANGPELAKQRQAFTSAIEAENKSKFFVNNTLYGFLGFVLALVCLGALAFFEVLGIEWLIIAAVAGGVIGIFTALIKQVWQAASYLRFVIIAFVFLGTSNVLGGFWTMFTDVSIDTGAIAAISLVAITIIFAQLMRAPTVSGRKVMDEIDGFRMYLDTAEKNRLNLVGEPPMTVERFEKILPYAIALGVEKPWSEHFEGELSRNAVADAQSGYSPGWYRGRNFSTGGFSNSVAAITSGMSAAMIAAQPASSSSSGFSSGGGGGGSSGGGGGGGGGGGW
jgi:Predicted membrane protein (DUF2207)